MHAGGYTVTMRIPFDVMRNARGGTVERAVRALRARDRRAASVVVRSRADAARLVRKRRLRARRERSACRRLSVARVAARSRAPRSTRSAEAASKSIGGSTSRVGADLSIPITPTASFYRDAFIPDYSNVELDQQTISPTVYQRYHSEVRPFFTQAANFYNSSTATRVRALQTLYTPAIPTPREGYAVEGKQGPIGFATFDAGRRRPQRPRQRDRLSRRPDTQWYAACSASRSNMPGFIDNVTTETGLGLLRPQTSQRVLQLRQRRRNERARFRIKRSTTSSAAAGRIRRSASSVRCARSANTTIRPTASSPIPASPATRSMRPRSGSSRPTTSSPRSASRAFVDRYQGPTRASPRATTRCSSTC